MNKKIAITGVALMLTLSLAGGVLAAMPNGTTAGGQGFAIGRSMGGLVTRVANYLGLEVAEVQSLRAEGTTFGEILGEQTEAFIAASVAERETIIAQMLADGKITAEQAEFCGSCSTERLTERLNSTELCLGNAVGAGKTMQQRRGR